MMMKSFLRRSTKRVVPGRVLDSVVRPAVRGVLSAAFGGRGYKISIGGQGVFRLSPDFVFRGWEGFGTRHNSGFAQCIAACKGKSVFIDVGAHIGLYSLPASSSLRPGGRVIAFEPSESNYGYLLKHIAYNGIDNIQAHQLVVGDVDRDSVLFYEHVVASSPLGSLIERKKKLTDRFVEARRRQISLDRFCAESSVAPDVIKVDTEGAELLVVKGARETLIRHRPMIFLSVHPSHLEAMGQSTGELEDLLAELDYEVRSTEDSPVSGLGSGEYICVPRSTAGHPGTASSRRGIE